MARLLWHERARERKGEREGGGGRERDIGTNIYLFLQFSLEYKFTLIRISFSKTN